MQRNTALKQLLNPSRAVGSSFARRNEIETKAGFVSIQIHRGERERVAQNRLGWRIEPFKRGLPETILFLLYTTFRCIDILQQRGKADFQDFRFLVFLWHRSLCRGRRRRSHGFESVSELLERISKLLIDERLGRLSACTNEVWFSRTKETVGEKQLARRWQMTVCVFSAATHSLMCHLRVFARNKVRCTRSQFVKYVPNTARCVSHMNRKERVCLHTVSRSLYQK